VRIYLATPYTHENPEVCHARYKAVNQVAADLIAQGHYVYSPITHCHPLIKLADLPGDWDYWHGYDKSFLEWCDELHVFMADGWRESKGVQAEIKIATELNKPVLMIREV